MARGAVCGRGGIWSEFPSGCGSCRDREGGGYHDVVVCTTVSPGFQAEASWNGSAFESGYFHHFQKHAQFLNRYGVSIIVVGDQDGAVFGLHVGLPAPISLWVSAGAGRMIGWAASAVLAVWRGRRQRHEKPTARAGLRFQPDPPAVAFDDGAHDVKPQPVAFGLARGQAVEQLEHSLPVLRRDADAVVGHAIDALGAVALAGDGDAAGPGRIEVLGRS